jgi:hypothetical protein
VSIDDADTCTAENSEGANPSKSRHQEHIMKSVTKTLRMLVIPAVLGVVVAVNGAVSASAFDARSFFEQIARDAK